MQYAQAVCNIERVYRVRRETMPAALLYIYCFKVNSEGEQVEIREEEGTIVQDYYLVSSSWNGDSLQVKLIKLRLPYS